jgi:pimeloyl-ACP methyl ester carboxylesterase
MQAASARFVLSAMEQAGIQAGERVALVGHSQGGIVAAAIASHENLAYRIDHIVTAGSPIANHPIPNSTWVTSVEIEDEVVSALDGAPNQQRDAWITVRGKVSKSQENSDASKYLSTLVSGSGTAKLLPHGMNYHRAAWQSVMDLGSVDAQEHDEHFSETISGELEESMFFHGQMTP